MLLEANTRFGSTWGRVFDEAKLGRNFDLGVDCRQDQGDDQLAAGSDGCGGHGDENVLSIPSRL
ncbi:MAG: hypothetical protein DRJ65_06570 [Acidobacteria bacterium]|nr:MAG: hypothetical protein DRJ65_06570 [Acidobacteriota bacterium]